MPISRLRLFRESTLARDTLKVRRARHCSPTFSHCGNFLTELWFLSIDRPLEKRSILDSSFLSASSLASDHSTPLSPTIALSAFFAFSGVVTRPETAGGGAKRSAVINAACATGSRRDCTSCTISLPE
ncbi:hypothetical protein BU26DRAFT_164467 [Trematosphaeria pertusa]|uniref:Uncharacterized protein n=1 Tax=Trematosphaeria pertusa TaxID=390896 RepID=A0A6A6HXG0_9PLEO|nr:uncharacterized protein BU26DRAFT_164467 [Trematosphaeria pertusa]KAF2242060.1 hypothetical protein BU26DRAFT_164467 [Trematosphaeria pertusa]